MPRTRYQPTPKHVRVRLGAARVADTAGALLIWEPFRVVPSYAVPEADVVADLEPAPSAPAPEYRPIRFGDGPEVLDPSVPFAVHTAPGESLVVRTPGGVGQAFRIRPPGLGPYIVLDFAGFDWWEEDEPLAGHPRDPFHRIDVRRTSRHVLLQHEGTPLAETTRARMLFEGTFPFARFYLPRQDVRVQLRPGARRTTCAYKGHATHYSAVVGHRELTDIAWSYEHPLPDAAEVGGLVCFYQERLTLIVDGRLLPRSRTPWS